MGENMGTRFCFESVYTVSRLFFKFNLRLQFQKQISFDYIPPFLDKHLIPRIVLPIIQMKMNTLIQINQRFLDC